MEKREKRTKTKLILLSIVFMLLLLIGGAAAFFTDIILENIQGTTGTLDLEETTPLRVTRYHMVRGEEEYQESSTLNILNPGDIVEVIYGVSNEGNKSAWIRDLITVDIWANELENQPTEGGVFRLYPILEDAMQTELAALRADIRNPLVDTDMLVLEESGRYGFEHVTNVEIMNGTGTDAEEETGGILGERVVGFLIYFISDAPQEYQGVNIAIRFTTQAMQYRNNTDPNWQNVVDDEFVLRRNYEP